MGVVNQWLPPSSMFYHSKHLCQFCDLNFRGILVMLCWCAIAGHQFWITLTISLTSTWTRRTVWCARRSSRTPGSIAASTSLRPPAIGTVYTYTYTLHCTAPFCFYSLKPLDIEFMKRLDHCVNIVPVIAKSDTLTVEEREAFKQRVRCNIPV